MKKQKGLGEISMMIFFVVAGFFLYCVIGAWECSSKWGKSGMASSFGPIQGCLVQTPGGRWIPEERVREVDLTPRVEPTGVPK
jgi:hypothetical protein